MRTLILMLLASLTLGFSAHADPGVMDHAKLFKPEAVEKVNADIQQIHKDFGKELVIETFSTIPDSLKIEFEAAKDDKDKRAEFFATWIGERAHELKVNGVYVLIVKDLGHVEVVAGAKTREKGEFTLVNRNKMRDILVNAFKAKDYDGGLQKAADYFREALKENLGGVRHTGPSVAKDENFRHRGGVSSGSPIPAPYRPPVSTPRNSLFSGSCMWIVLVVIAAIVIIRILSGLGSGPRNYGGGPGYGPGQGPGYGGGGPGYGPGYGGGGYGGGYGGGGGGGFFRNMLGGMLGGAAGGYLYDRFRDRNEGSYGSPQNQGGVTPDNSSGGDFGSSSAADDDNDRGQGFGGGGSSGDFGPSDSGSSFGSSDSGSSGGDFGGGGGDSGGGGGGDSGGSSGGDF